MDILWGGMLLLGIVYGAAAGHLREITEAALDASKEAVTLAAALAGVTAFWTGILKIAEKGGIVERLSARLSPLLDFFFPELPPEHPAREPIAVNMISNLLGLGAAATPAGLRAMEALAVLEEDRRAGRASGRARPAGTAGNEMCTFLILNISSLQLVPMNMIAYRSQYGSTAPASIAAPALLATLASTIAAAVFCMLRERLRQ